MSDMRRESLSMSTLRHLDSGTLRAENWTARTIMSRKEPVAVLIRYPVYLEMQRQLNAADVAEKLVKDD